MIQSSNTSKKKDMKTVIISREAKQIKKFECQMVTISSNHRLQTIEFFGIPGKNGGEFAMTHTGSLHYDVDHLNKRAFCIFINEPVRIDITW